MRLSVFNAEMIQEMISGGDLLFHLSCFACQTAGSPSMSSGRNAITTSWMRMPSTHCAGNRQLLPVPNVVLLTYLCYLDLLDFPQTLLTHINLWTQNQLIQKAVYSWYTNGLGFSSIPSHFNPSAKLTQPCLMIWVPPTLVRLPGSLSILSTSDSLYRFPTNCNYLTQKETKHLFSQLHYVSVLSTVKKNNTHLEKKDTTVPQHSHQSPTHRCHSS